MTPVNAVLYTAYRAVLTGARVDCCGSGNCRWRPNDGDRVQVFP